MVPGVLGMKDCWWVHHVRPCRVVMVWGLLGIKVPEDLTPRSCVSSSRTCLPLVLKPYIPKMFQGAIFVVLFLKLIQSHPSKFDSMKRADN